MSVSTHVLDTSRGRPAAAVPVRLEYADGDRWQPVATGQTDADGRLADWGAAGDIRPGVYRLVFDTGSYLGEAAFFPEVVVTFRVAEPAEHHHLPLLLNPFSYTTYRGS